MKKLVLLSLVLIGIASLASASPVVCSVLMSAPASGAASSLCTVTADPGFYISDLTLTGTDDYTGWQSGNPIVSFFGNITQTAGLDTPFTDPTFCNVTTTAQHSSPCAITPNPSTTVSNTNTAITSYSLGLVNAGDSFVGGVVTGASIVLNLDFAETQIPTTGTPEPATFGMMGGALVGLGLLSRRKK